MTSTQRIRKLLIANRGDVASRVMATAKRMGIATVAVFSEADALLPFVREADEAVCIGPAAAAESYLSIERILEAAARVRADAIHPGWGFLAENARFARAVEDAGLIFVGPTPESIETMGDKRRAKAIAIEMGIPVIEGIVPESQEFSLLLAAARELGAPLLLKASAGGGGKGMKRLDSLEGVEDAIRSAQREAEAAFGDGSLLLERYIDQARHVEVQVLADGAGNVIHAYERECSIQRRHQKIIEECPSPAVDHGLRCRMGEAAVRCAQAIGYRGVGTVEFLLAPDRSFHFLEMNTRLQVEHATTEMVTGLDLVEEQLRVARGERLRFIQDEIPLSGHALEVRLYAEDPAKDFLPQTGTLFDFAWEDVPGLRVEASVERGSVVSTHYDPMLARLVIHAGDRQTAIDRMIRCLSGLGLAGVQTNRRLLVQALEHEAFRSGDTHTHFIPEHLAEALHEGPARESLIDASVAGMLFGFEMRRREAEVLSSIPRGYRNNFHTHEALSFDSGVEGQPPIELRYRHLGEGRFELLADAQPRSVTLLGLEAHELRWELDGLRRQARVVEHQDTFFVTTLSAAVSVRQRARFPERVLEAIAGACIAPMPGRVLSLSVALGERVEAGQRLAVLEAMKMEHEVRAPHAGEIVRVDVAEGDQVDADALLFVIQLEDEAE